MNTSSAPANEEISGDVAGTWLTRLFLSFNHPRCQRLAGSAGKMQTIMQFVVALRTPLLLRGMAHSSMDYIVDAADRRAIVYYRPAEGCSQPTTTLRTMSMILCSPNELAFNRLTYTYHSQLKLSLCSLQKPFPRRICQGTQELSVHQEATRDVIYVAMRSFNSCKCNNLLASDSLRGILEILIIVA